MMIRRALAVCSVAVAAACSVEVGSPGGGELGQTKQAVIKGKASDASQDAVVLLVHYDPDAGTFGQCTGTLLAPRLVLTARHCVADTDEYAACDAQGNPLAAGVVRRNKPAKTMHVFTGKDRPRFGRDEVKPAGTGMQILDDGGKNLCNRDFALIVLEAPIENASIAPIRLDGDVTVGETITAIGWGLTDNRNNPSPDVRQQRTGVTIEEVGPVEGGARVAAVPPNEFQVGESICSGDSGGPAIAEETGAVVGVVSRGGRAGAQSEDDPAAGCIRGENLYTKTMPFKDLVMEAYELAEAEPWPEGGPDPRKLKPSALCADSSECRSNICLGDPAQGGKLACAEDCSASTCATGLSCVKESGFDVCRPPSADEGCSTSPNGKASGSTILVGLGLALALVSRRRKHG